MSVTVKSCGSGSNRPPLLCRAQASQYEQASQKHAEMFYTRFLCWSIPVRLSGNGLRIR